MHNIETVEQYQHLVDEALIEVEEMQASIDFDREYMENTSYFIEPIKTTLEQLKQELKTNSHQFGGEDLPYMKFLTNIPTEILPIKYLLKVINEVHTEARL